MAPRHFKRRYHANELTDSLLPVIRTDRLGPFLLDLTKVCLPQGERVLPIPLRHRPTGDYIGREYMSRRSHSSAPTTFSCNKLGNKLTAVRLWGEKQVIARWWLSYQIGARRAHGRRAPARVVFGAASFDRSSLLAGGGFATLSRVPENLGTARAGGPKLL